MHSDSGNFFFKYLNALVLKKDLYLFHHFGNICILNSIWMNGFKYLLFRYKCRDFDKKEDMFA